MKMMKLHAAGKHTAQADEDRHMKEMAKVREERLKANQDLFNRVRRCVCGVICCVCVCHSVFV